MLLRPLIVRSGGLRPPAVALAGFAVGAAGAFVASTEQAEAVSPVATRTPHALYVWGGNDGCTVPQSGVTVQQRPEFGVAEAGGARGVAASRAHVVGRPRAVPFFDSRGISAIAFADTHAAAVDHAGKLYVWGAAYAAKTPCCQLSREQASEPQELGGSRDLTQVVCTAKNVFALSMAGEVLTMRAEHAAATVASALTPVVGAEGKRLSAKIVKLAAGEGHLCALSEDGAVYTMSETCCGKPNQLIQVTGGDMEKDSDTGKMVGDKFVPDGRLQTRVADVDCGRAHTVALLLDGRVVGWGEDNWMQLGQGVPTGSGVAALQSNGTGTTVRRRKEPTLMRWTRGSRMVGRAVSVAAGGDSTFVVVSAPNGETQSLYSCGFGSYGTLGAGGRTHAQGHLNRVPKLSGARYYDEVLGKHGCVTLEQLSVGKAHVVAAQHPTPEDPIDFFTWGANALAQQGNGLRADGTTPKVASWSPPGRLPLRAPVLPTRTWWGGSSSTSAAVADDNESCSQVEGVVVCDGENTAFFAPRR